MLFARLPPDYPVGGDDRLMVASHSPRYVREVRHLDGLGTTRLVEVTITKPASYADVLDAARACNIPFDPLAYSMASILSVDDVRDRIEGDGFDSYRGHDAIDGVDFKVTAVWRPGRVMVVEEPAGFGTVRMDGDVLVFSLTALGREMLYAGTGRPPASSMGLVASALDADGAWTHWDGDLFRMGIAGETSVSVSFERVVLDEFAEVISKRLQASPSD